MSEIQTTGNAVIGVGQTIIAVLQASVPAIAAASNPINAAMTAAAIAVNLADKFAQMGVMSVQEQIELKQWVADFVVGNVFSGPQWQPRPESPDYTKPS